MLVLILLVIYGVLIYHITRNTDTIVESLNEVNDNFNFMYEETFGFPPTSDEERVANGE